MNIYFKETKEVEYVLLAWIICVYDITICLKNKAMGTKPGGQSGDVRNIKTFQFLCQP